MEGFFTFCGSVAMLAVGLMGIVITLKELGLL